MKWEVFTQEEREIIQALADKKEFETITHALRMQSPEQEYWLGEFLKELKPVPAPLESKVRKDLEMELAKDPTNTVLDSPDKEAEWQKKIDEELKVHEKEVKGEENVSRETNEVGEPPVGTGEEPKAEEKSLEEVKTEVGTEESTIKCDICDKEFKNEHGLNIHKAHSHK